MDIIVCVKQIPETAEVKLSIDESGKEIKAEGLIQELNEWDEYALEEALLLKKNLGGHVTAVTMGPEGADAVLRRCLAKGADSAIWLKDESFRFSDAYATAKILHEAIKNLSLDLVLCGAQASDDGYSAVGVMLAELLGIPHASMVKKIKVTDRSARVNRELEGGLEEVLEVKLPALLTIQTGINEPRYVSIMGIRRARKKEIKILELDDIGLSRMEVGEQGSWVKIEDMFEPAVEKELVMLRGGPDEIADEFVGILRKKGLI
jgi:electron transfer flavoprotein beta subunit